MNDDRGFNKKYVGVDIIGGYRGRGLLTRKGKLSDSIHFNKHLWFEYTEINGEKEYALSMNDFKYIYSMNDIPYRFKKEEL